MNRLSMFIACAITAASMLGAQSAPVPKPDFAYPVKVITDASATLDDSSSSAIERMEAVMQIVTARSAIDSDSIFTAPQLIGTYADSEQDSAVKGLLLLYEADTYNTIYKAAQYKYDKVDAPLEPYPAEVSQWSGLQFKTRIRELIKESIATLTPVGTTSSATYNHIISLPKESTLFYPYLRDFAYSKAETLAKSIGDKTLIAELRTDFLKQVTPGTPEWAISVATDYNTLTDNYKKYPDGISGGVLLYYLADNRQMSHEETVNNLKKYLDSEPVSILTEPLKCQLANYTIPQCYISLPSTVSPGEEIKLPINVSYAKSAGVTIYKCNIPAPRYYDRRTSRTKISNLEKPYDNQQYNASDTLSISFPSAGYYFIIPTINGKQDAYNGQLIEVSDYRSYIVQSGNDAAISLADAKDGHPVIGANLYYVSEKDGSIIKKLGTTDSDGICRYTVVPGDRNISRRVAAVVNGHKSIFSINGPYYTGADKDEAIRTSFMLSRPVYRAGETVEWSVAITKSNPQTLSTTPIKNQDYKIIMRDANGTPVDTLDVTTDEYGRAAGAFTIPEGRLTGYYSLHILNKNYLGSQSFMVSDFKTPQIEISAATVEIISQSIARISGNVKTLSGMPVADADILININSVPLWWWRYTYDNISINPVTCKTDDNGNFSVDINIPNSTESRRYEADIQATSASMEVADHKITFNSGKPYAIICRIDNALFNVDGNPRIPVKPITLDGKSTSLDVTWKISRGNDEICAGSCLLDSLGIKADIANLDAGKYKLTVSPADTTLCNTATFEITFYSINRNRVPKTHPLMVLDNKITLDGNNHADIRIGVPDTSYIYVAISGHDTLIDTYNRKVDSGFNDIRIEIPADCRKATATLAVYTPGKGFTTDVIQIARKDNTAVKLSAESWRDKLIPGMPEQIRLNLRRADGQPISGALVATMYNKALDQLGVSLPNVSNLDLSAPGWWFNTTPNNYYQSFHNNSIFVQAERKSSMTYLLIPAPNFLYRPEVYSAVFGMMRSAGVPQLSNKMALSESAVVSCCDAAKECEAEEAELPADTGAAGGASDNDSDKDFKYREGEILQAFWQPDLSFGTDGTATISFNVPNTSATWHFNAWGWTDDVNTSVMTAYTIANKPVMVQPNLPRFLRQGDNAKILASIYNNTDSTTVTTTTIEIFDIYSGTVTSTVTMTDTIAANASATAAIDVLAPTTTSAIGYRIKTTDGTFTDGEQNVIPVLSSLSTVIESTVFYLNSDNPTFSAKLPADKTGVTVLQYCQNPVWDAVKALPATMNPSDNSACSSAQAIYGALTARGLAGKFPEIPATIKSWNENQADSALVSKLYKNEELKTVMLEQTPWVKAAATETERMQNLTNTFDEKEIKNILDKAIKNLEKLQLTSGGFRWGGWSDEPSVWVTTNVLATIGRLNANGFLTADSRLGKIIDKAFNYLDNNIKNDEYSYTRVYALYPGRQPSTLAGKNAINKEIQNINRNWKSASTTEKCENALILMAFNHNAVANEILQSVRQFEVKSPLTGISFPSVKSTDSYATILEAFAKIDAPEIEGLRQWLILSTQTSDNLNSYNPTRLISALLSTGERWTAINSTSDIIIGGNPVTVSDIEAMTGSFSQRIPTDKAGKTIKISRPQTASVSYGSVSHIGARPMNEIEAVSSSDISISKRLLTNRNGEWIEVADPAVGERVRVQLLIVAKRDLQYVTVTDDRAAALEPVDQLPGYIHAGGLNFYRENNDSATHLFINFLRAGTYYLTYDMNVTLSGSFSSGTATIQSQYAPEINARSAGYRMTVR